MKKFYFSLDNVLSYKDQVLNNLKNEHGVILAEIRKCEERIDELQQEYDACGKKLDAGKMEGMIISEIRTYENFMESLRIKIRRERERLSELREQEERKKQEVVEAKKETSAIEKLKEKKLEQYKKQEQKQEELFMEEFVSTKSALAKIHG